MSTRISDVIVPEVFNPYVVQRTTETSALYQSGIIASVPDLKVPNGGRTVNIPFWNDLSGEDEVLEDTPGWALTPDKISAGQDVAAIVMRGRAWSVNDLATTLSGDDPMGAIADLVAAYWNRRMQAALIASAKGIFNGPLKDTHVLNIASEDGAAATDANKISGEVIVDGVAKLGDAHEKLTGIVMHSVPYFNLVKKNLIEFAPDSEGKLTIPMYMGKRVVVDDGCPAVAGATSGKKYWSFLFGPGAFAYADGSPEYPSETDRDKLAGEDILITRKHFILHPRGVKWTDNTVAKQSPSNAEMELVANWNKVYQDKHIRMVALITNG